MLVLSRRIGEEIVIAGGINVTVVAVKGNQVRLGVTAPPEVHVLRQELLAVCDERDPPQPVAGIPGEGQRTPEGSLTATSR